MASIARCRSDKAIPGKKSRRKITAVLQRGQASGSSLGHGLSNLFHGHSWNYTQESVIHTIVTEGVREPNPYVAVGTDALGVVGEATGHSSLGRVGAAISVVNNPSPLNIAVTGAAFLPVVGETVGAVSAVGDVDEIFPEREFYTRCDFEAGPHTSLLVCFGSDSSPVADKRLN